jgi:hypothetical protein
MCTDMRGSVKAIAMFAKGREEARGFDHDPIEV